MEKGNKKNTRWKKGLFIIVVLFSYFSIGYLLNLSSSKGYSGQKISTSSTHTNDLSYLWSGPFQDYPSSAAIDSLGNLYIVGDSYSYSVGLEDILLIKFNSTGGLEWFRTWGGPDYEYGIGIAIDSFDDIYVTGRTNSFGAGHEDIVTVKYNSFGVQLWNTTWGGTENDLVGSLEIDSDNNVYVGGRTDSYGIYSEAVLLKYNSSGSLIWDARWEGGTNEEINAVEIDAENNIYIAGEFQNTTGDFTAETFIIKYNSSGDFQWSKSWGGNNRDSAQEIAIDSFNNIYTSGSTVSFGDGEDDVFILKYNSSGALITSQLIGIDGNDWFHGIAVDTSDNLHLLYERESIGTNHKDILLKYNQSGTLISNKSINNVEITPVGMSIDLVDNLYIYGFLQNATNSDIVVYRFGIDYDEDGLSDWQEINIFLTNHLNPDTDEDFLNDGVEVNVYSTNPLNNDTDNDGLLDGPEVNTYFTNPLNRDTDGDTLSDGDEINIYGTNPNLQDSDGDGFRDDLEVALGFDPNNPGNSPLLLFIFIAVSATLVISLITYMIIRIKKKNKMLREKEVYEKIPNLKILIRNYVYHQLRAINEESNIINIELKDLDNTVRQQLDMNIGNFLQFLELEDIKLTKNQIKFLKFDSFEESEPIRRDLTQLITKKLEEKELEERRRDLERQLEKELRTTKDSALQDELKKRYYKKLEALRTVDEEIDALLNQYSSWDTSDDFKKL